MTDMEYMFAVQDFLQNQAMQLTKAKRKDGENCVCFAWCKKVFSTPAVKLKLEYDDKVIEDKFALMLILNSRNVAGFRLNRKALLNDGLVDVVLIKSRKEDKVPFRSVCTVAKFFLKGLAHQKIQKYYNLAAR